MKGKQLFEVKEQTVKLVDRGKLFIPLARAYPQRSSQTWGKLQAGRKKDSIRSTICYGLFGFYFAIVARTHTCSVGGLQWRSGVPAVTAALSIVH